MPVSRATARRSAILTLAAFTAFLTYIISPDVTLAQLTSNRNVAILPFICEPADSLLANLLQKRFLAGIRASAFLIVMDSDEIRQSLQETQVTDVLKSGHAMGEYAEETNSAFVIGGVVRREESGGLSVSIIVYGQDDSEIISVESGTYPDEVSALAGVESIARKLSHPRNLTPSDTSFFYSLFLPGSGQISRGRWEHAALSIGLLSAAIVYGLRTPAPDPYTIPEGHFREEWDQDTRIWSFYVGGTEVDWIEYDKAYKAALAHAGRASKQRRAVENRRRRAVGYIIGAWMFNLLDTLLISRRNVDGGPFFDQVESAIVADPQTLRLGIRFSIRLPFRN